MNAATADPVARLLWVEKALEAALAELGKCEGCPFQAMLRVAVEAGQKRRNGHGWAER